METNRLGNIYGENFGQGYAGNVWDKLKICPTLTTMQGGNREPMIIEEKCLTGKENKECLSRAEQSRAEQSRAEQLNYPYPSSNEGRIHQNECTRNCGFGISDIINKKGKSNRERTDLSNLADGEYP